MNWVIKESMSLKYEPASEPLHIYVEGLFLCLAPKAVRTDEDEAEGGTGGERLVVQRALVRHLQGYLAHKKTPTPLEPP